MNTDEVQEYVDRSQQLIEASPQMDEENTKVRLIQPFLELLGWDFYSTEVELEYTIPMASGSTHVDYALLIGDTPVVFVEAKSVRSDLSTQNVRQLKSYMRQELGVDWGILTNGKTFEVLTKNRRQNGGEEVSVARFDLNDLADDPDVLELLSKESIRSGRADEIAEQVARTNQVIRELQEDETGITETVTEAVENEVGDFPINLEDQARQFIQDLVSVLREQRQFTREEPSIEPDEAVTGSADDPDNPDDLEPIVNRVAGTLSRKDIEGEPDATVAVFPTRESGLPFLKENEAWGFVRVGRDFDYVAMYVTGDVREVRYFAETDRIVTPEEADLKREPLDYKDRAKIAEDKMVIEFKSGSLYELEDPIPYETKYPQGLRYTTLGELREATTTNDIF
jgi:hypothetical protein